MTSLAYLYRRDAEELLEEMIGAGMECVLIKVACMGLDQKHLGKTYESLLPFLALYNKLTV